MSTAFRANGGYAFPSKGMPGLDICGMTLRDYFAAAALPALIAQMVGQLEGEGFGADFHDDESMTFDTEYLCETAYDIADGMIAERSKS